MRLDLKVIMLRGVLDEGVHFLQKPFTPQSLSEKVRSVLNSRSPDGFRP